MSRRKATEKVAIMTTRDKTGTAIATTSPAETPGVVAVAADSVVSSSTKNSVFVREKNNNVTMEERGGIFLLSVSTRLSSAQMDKVPLSGLNEIFAKRKLLVGITFDYPRAS